LSAMEYPVLLPYSILNSYCNQQALIRLFILQHIHSNLLNNPMENSKKTML
jgi:hypothetical protein